MELDEAMREASAQVLEALEEQYPEDEPFVIIGLPRKNYDSRNEPTGNSDA